MIRVRPRGVSSGQTKAILRNFATGFLLAMPLRSPAKDFFHVAAETQSSSLNASGDGDFGRYRPWQLPPSALIRGGKGRWLLCQVLQRYVPAELVERPNAGFANPIGDWIRGPLAEWANDLHSESALRSTGLFDVKLIRGM